MQLDKEYQELKSILGNCGKNDPVIVADLYLIIKYCVLLCDESVEIVPAFLAESRISRLLFNIHPDILDSRYIELKMKESDKKEYIEKREREYRGIHGYDGYGSSEFKNIILNSRCRVSPKSSSKQFIINSISEFVTNGLIRLNRREMRAINNGLLVMEEKPIIWENFKVEITEKEASLSQRNMFFRRLLCSEYQNSILSDSDTAFVSYRNLSFLDDEVEVTGLYDLNLFERALRIWNVFDDIVEMNLAKIEELKDTIEFIDFKEAYIDIVIMHTAYHEIIKKISDAAKGYKDDLKQAISQIIEKRIIVFGASSKMENSIHGLEPVVRSEMRSAAIVFSDIVGFSKEISERQLILFEALRFSISESFVGSSFSNALIIPTGDGAAIVVEDHRSKSSIVELCAKFAKTARVSHGIQLRVGLHYGDIHILELANKTFNAIGHNMNMAARVMDIGDAGHILISDTFYKAFIERSNYQNSAHHLGEATIKHGETIGVYNFYERDVGNSNRPAKMPS